MNGSDISVATGAGLSLLGLDVRSQQLYGPVIHVSLSWGDKACLLTVRSSRLSFFNRHGQLYFLHSYFYLRHLLGVMVPPSLGCT